MAKTRPETIILKGDPIMSELEAGGVITPGHLVARNSAGAVVVHAGAGLVAPPTFAKENDIAGDDYEHAYASGEVVQFFTAYGGMQVQAILADGENASIGSFLESNGSGELRVVDADTSAGTVKPGSIICVAIEAVDMSDSAGADPSNRIKVEVV